MVLPIPDFPIVRPGYEFADVHRFTKWAQERLQHTDTLPDEAVSAVTFRLGRRGYSPAAVDDWIDTLPVGPRDPEVESGLDTALHQPANMPISADSDARGNQRRLIIPILLLSVVVIFLVLQLTGVV